MTETQWYYADATQQRQGPLPTHALRALHAQGKTDIDTLVWCEGMPQWKPLHSVSALSAPEPWRDPYAAPASSLEVGGGHAPALDDKLQLYAAFVGRNFPVYRRKWRLDQPGHPASGWHWPAFLFGAFWMLYRRMYAVAAGWIAILVGLAVVETLIGASSGLSSATTLGASAVAGAMGNHFYLRHANRIIAQAKASHGENTQALQAELAARGGARWLSVVLGLLVYFAVLGAIAVLVDP
ncbi:MAG: GYF domain-containing protein [Stenotrophomonas sp.]|uniref:GYF domain-containing protein n=1 Tax=Stenotrophomonas sp. TaxID=69392 RepID=UPI003D6D1580